jgi:hypothetical protein
VDWLGWMWSDMPTRVAVVGVVVYAAVILALVLWAGHHYVRSLATSWRWTTWDKAAEAERRQVDEGDGTASEAADRLDWQEAT